MHVLVYGTGAVGGYFGARLATGGHEVTLVARGANLAALRADGLRVHLAPTNETLHVRPIRAVERPADAPPADLVLVCVKSYDTIAAADALRPVVRPDTVALSLQNGVENETIIAERLGWQAGLGMGAVVGLAGALCWLWIRPAPATNVPHTL